MADEVEERTGPMALALSSIFAVRYLARIAIRIRASLPFAPW